MAEILNFPRKCVTCGDFHAEDFYGVTVYMDCLPKHITKEIFFAALESHGCPVTKIEN